MSDTPTLATELVELGRIMALLGERSVESTVWHVERLAEMERKQQQADAEQAAPFYAAVDHLHLLFDGLNDDQRSAAARSLADIITEYARLSKAYWHLWQTAKPDGPHPSPSPEPESR